MRWLAGLTCLILLAAGKPAPKPSFSCAGELSLAETAICSDPELADWDRAVAVVYRGRDKNFGLQPDKQREWLKQRDQCGADRACLLSAYRQWPGYSDMGGKFAGVSFDRAGNDRIDFAYLDVLPIHGNWIYFWVSAIHVQNPPYGVHNGEAGGVIELHAGRGIYGEDPGDPYACRFYIDRAGRGWRIEQFGENTQCGGVNVSMSGDYVRHRRR